jgi:hypothetical protein
MHPTQQTLLNQATALNNKLAASTTLWKYNCPDTGKVFYLTEKVMTIRSPWTGKTFTTKPERETLGDVGKALREESKTGSRANDACPSRDAEPGAPHIYKQGKCVFCGQKR